MTYADIPVCRLKPGTVVNYHGTEYKVWRVLPVVKPGGWGAVATLQDHGGNWDGPAALLYYANEDAEALAVKRVTTIAVVRGMQLSDREKQVLILLSKGNTYSEAGRKLGLSPHTVKTYCYQATVKLGARNKMQAGILALITGAIKPLDVKP